MLKILLSVLVVISFGILLLILISIKIEKPINPLIQLKKELKSTDLTTDEINSILEEYKDSFSYSCYELKKSCYELGKSLKKIQKK